MHAEFSPFKMPACPDRQGHSDFQRTSLTGMDREFTSGPCSHQLKHSPRQRAAGITNQLCLVPLLLLSNLSPASLFSRRFFASPTCSKNVFRELVSWPSCCHRTGCCFTMDLQGALLDRALALDGQGWAPANLQAAQEEKLCLLEHSFSF